MQVTAAQIGPSIQVPLATHPKMLLKLVRIFCTPSVPCAALWYPSFGDTPLVSLFEVTPLVSSFESTELPAFVVSPFWPHWYCAAPLTPEDAAVFSHCVYASSS